MNDDVIRASCAECRGPEPAKPRLNRERAVFVRANFVDDDGDIYRSGAHDPIHSYDLYLQAEGEFPYFHDSFKNLADALCEARTFAQFARCDLYLELPDGTRSFGQPELTAVPWAVAHEQLRVEGWIVSRG